MQVIVMFRNEFSAFDDWKGRQRWADISPPGIAPASIPFNSLLKPFAEGRFRLPAKTAQFRTVHGVTHVVEWSVFTLLYISLDLFFRLKR